MNKNIKKIVAVALTISAFSAIAPAANINLFTTKAYASSDDADELDELTLETSSGSNIKLYKSSSYSTKIDSDEIVVGKTYYAKTSSSKVVIDIDGADEDNVRIFKGSSTTDYEVGDKISLSSGTTTLKIRVFEDAFDDYDDDYSSSDYNEYKIVVKNTSSDDDDDDDYDDIYLSDITLSEGDIDFDEDETSYDVDVDNDVSSITVKAEPEDDDYTVKINGTTVDDDDNYKKKVSLSVGDNTVKIKITDDDDNERIYTLNITRASATSSSSSTTNSNTTSSNSQTSSDAQSSPSVTGPAISTTINKWVNENGKWKYYDASGNALINTWFTDKNYGKTYYLQADGTMATGWLQNSGTWYYLDSSGAKQVGWQSVGGTWYYLDSEGKMLTGWFKDTDGNWYYLQSSGAMAKNTTIGGYKLGSNGAWIK